MVTYDSTEAGTPAGPNLRWVQRQPTSAGMLSNPRAGYDAAPCLPRFRVVLELHALHEVCGGMMAKARLAVLS